MCTIIIHREPSCKNTVSLAFLWFFQTTPVKYDRLPYDLHHDIQRIGYLHVSTMKMFLKSSQSCLPLFSTVFMFKLSSCWLNNYKPQVHYSFKNGASAALFGIIPLFMPIPQIIIWRSDNSGRQFNITHSQNLNLFNI